MTYSGFFNPKGSIKNWCTLENADRAIIGSVKPSIINENTVRNIDAKNGNVIAWADYTESGSFDWKPITVELKYISDDSPALTNVIISAGNIWDSRAAVTDNYIDADNVRYAYFSRLSDASIDGYAFDFNPNTLDYVITVNDVENFTLPTGVNYSIMSNEALTADKEATVSNINDNKQISIKVTNKQSIANAEATDADGLREHTYNFYFREAPQQFEGFYFTNVNGTDIYSGETTTLTLTQENADYHTYTLAIADVKVAQAATRAAGDAVNVTVSGLTKTEKDGKVIYSGWYGGYGKVVIIEHGIVNGKPITTLYAHMNTIKVSNGQRVSKGDVVGYEGTTGYSTGPHCHFEVRVNGQPNNPLNYI